MSKELDLIIEDCDKRLEFLNTQRDLQGCDQELNNKLWWAAYKRLCAATNAKLQQQGMHWTTSGDFSHIPAVGIGF